MNFDIVRRMVSGKKARFNDEETGVDLDLAYITDRIIIMGYPASGFEGLYRNRRSDVRKWLESRHGRNWRLYNFCPRAENEYDAAVRYHFREPRKYFYGQVRRFPFPDHHPPPLSMMPLFAFDIKTFLESSPQNVAVIHCKAGKGRSGTMTISYLQTLSSLPKPPQIARNYSASYRKKSNSNGDTSLPDDGSATSGIVTSSSDASLASSVSALSTTSSIDDGNVGEQSADQQGEARKQSLHGASGSASVAMDAHGIRGEEKGARAARRAQTLAAGLMNIGRKRGKSETSGADEDVIKSIDGDVSPGDHVKIPSPSSGAEGDAVASQAEDSIDNEPGQIAITPDADDAKHTQDASDTRDFGEVALVHKSPAECTQDADDANDAGEASLMHKSPAEREAALMADKVKFLFNLHTSRRMADPGVAYGVSIPSQRRWISYWGRVLTGDDRRGVGRNRQVEIKWIRVTMPDDVTISRLSGNRIAVQISTYKDSFIDNLRQREEQLNEARRLHHAAQRRARSKSGDTIVVRDEDVNRGQLQIPDHDDETWDDREELIQNFASFGEEDSEYVERVSKEEVPITPEAGEGALPIRHLTPVRLYPTNDNSDAKNKVKGGESIDNAGGVRVDAHREVQFKLVLGSTGSRHGALPDVVALGYFWMIPAFHGSPSNIGLTVTSFPNTEIDFRKKQAKIMQVDVGWKWLSADTTETSAQ